jgi:hypothetical protein
MTIYDKIAQKKLVTTVIDLTIHLVLSVALAVYFYWLTGGWVWPILAIIGGILIDTDHFIDYFLYCGPTLDLLGFFTHRHLASGKIYVVLHSWELVFLMWLGSLAVLWITPLVAGMTVHLLVDTFSRRRKSILFYSLIYRAFHGFKREKIETCLSFDDAG